MKRLFLIILLLATTLISQSVWAEGNIGLTYSQIIEERMLGLTGAYTTEFERVTFEAHGNLQAGDVYNLKINTDFTFDVAAIDLKLLIENKAKGYTLDSLGREQSMGLAFTVPIDNANVDVGIGGASSSPFSAPSAYDTLVAEGFSEREIEGKGLKALSPAPSGIPFRNGNTLNAFISTGFKGGIFDIDVRGIVELLGEGDKMHQFNTTFKTSGDVYGTVVTTSIEVGLASYQDVIHYELATVTTVGIDF